MRLILTYMRPGAGEAAAAELTQFFKANRSQFVKERDPAQMQRAVDSKKMLVLRNPAGDLRGTCGLFEYGNGDFREAGAVRVLDEGFGLQRLLMSAAVISEWTFDPPLQPIFAATAQENIASITNISRAGFVETRDLGAARIAALGIAELDEKKRYFLYPETAVRPSIDFFSKTVDRGQIEKAHGILKIDFDLPIVDIGLPKL